MRNNWDGEKRVTGFKQHFISSADGTRLAYCDYPGKKRAGEDSSDRLPVICLPGLTRNARDFHALALAISTAEKRSRRVIAIDYRGRGVSDRAADPATYSIPVETQDLLTQLDHLGIGRAIFIGTSRGGLILHVLATIAPDKIAGVIFNDIGPELALQGLLDIQTYLKETPPLADWSEAAAHLRRVHGQSFPALSEQDWQELAHALYVETPEGIKADCDPAIAAAFAGADLSASPLPALWEAFDAFPPVPMMVVRGEYSTLLTPQTVEAMKARRANLITVTASGQGHAPLLHLEELREKILTFIATVDD
jgi:pimeloyl-ACP methyl ester carboxylesterase